MIGFKTYNKIAALNVDCRTFNHDFSAGEIFYVIWIDRNIAYLQSLDNFCILLSTEKIELL